MCTEEDVKGTRAYEDLVNHDASLLGPVFVAGQSSCGAILLYLLSQKEGPHTPTYAAQ